MNRQPRHTPSVSKKARPIAVRENPEPPSTAIAQKRSGSAATAPDEPRAASVDDLVKSEFERFVEISKHFSSPSRRTASYVCESGLVSFPTPFRVEYKRGGVTTRHITFGNLTLEPVYIKLYKLVPDLEQLKYINLSLSRCKRIPPGLSFNLGFVYDDLNEKPSCDAKMVFVASRKTTTPCYQICEIDLQISAQKVRLVTV